MMNATSSPQATTAADDFAAPFESHAKELAELREAGELAELREALVECGVDPRDPMQLEELANRLDSLTQHLVDVSEGCPKTDGASIMLHPRDRVLLLIAAKAILRALGEPNGTKTGRLTNCVAT